MVDMSPSDVAVMIWDENITDKFTNADTGYADPDPDFEWNKFHKTKQTIRSLKAQAKSEHSDIITNLLKALLQNISLNQPSARDYYILHRNSAYVHGLGSRTTVQLGHMYVY